MFKRLAGGATATIAAAMLIGGSLFMAPAAAVAADQIDNSALSETGFRAHERTFGLVYTLPAAVNEQLARTIAGPLKQALLTEGLIAEAVTPNIPHVTVVHVHNADPTTPDRMLAALPDLPPVLDVSLTRFYTTEAAKGAGQPWWLDLGVVKEGAGYEAMMAFDTTATAALTPLRDGPLPRVTGPVYAAMSDAGKELVKTVGVSGVNVMKDGTEVRSHNPHTTLVYSMARFTPDVQAAMDKTASAFNQIIPAPIDTRFTTVSIVELGFAGNVTREIYRISLEDGSVLNVATGQTMPAVR
ncbi:hypothetical protein GCM10011505_03340 [Tistrella bauzanensis]|uniref:Uncharacterized protein n=1 Tax=Tistrella bauzanensis TaxID=657419 RepID=A0ABQ1I7V4_9PROT|nr:hypothetical protein GCM10011505_03340 [Tistrella bauzanensis]